MQNRKYTKKNKAFIDAYFGPARRNAAEAARMVGYKGRGDNILRALDIHIRKREAELSAAMHLSAEQVVNELCKVAQDDKNPAQKVRALEILSKIHGLHSDKVNVTIDRKLVQEDLEKSLQALSRLALSDPTVLSNGTAH